MANNARRPAYAPRLELAIIARPVFQPRGGLSLRPHIFTERAQIDRITSLREIQSRNTASFSSQTFGTGGPGGGAGGGGFPEDTGGIDLTDPVR